MKSAVTIIAISLAASLAACAPTSTPDNLQLASNETVQPQSCFYMNQVTGYSHASESSLLVNASLGRTFKADFVGRCADINQSVNITLKPEKVVSSRLCGGDYAVLTTNSIVSEHDQCRVRVVRLLSEEETASIREQNVSRSTRQSALGN